MRRSFALPLLTLTFLATGPGCDGNAQDDADRTVEALDTAGQNAAKAGRAVAEGARQAGEAANDIGAEIGDAVESARD